MRSPRPRHGYRPAIHLIAALLVLAGLATGLATLLGARPRIAEAQCNIIPGVVLNHRGAAGQLNRPYASPGDFVGVRVDPANCDDPSTSISHPSNRSASLDEIASAHAVTVLFDPPPEAPLAMAHAIVLATDCGSIDTASCEAMPGVASASCRAVLGDELLVRADEKGRRTLFFRFPDTSALNGGLGLAGPARIVVTRVGEPLRCEVEDPARTCVDLDPTGHVACVDRFYETDGSCQTERLAPIFPGFTALPPPNDFQALCGTDPSSPTSQTSPCNGPSGDSLLFTADSDGNILIPWDFTGILIREGGKGGVPIARLAEGTASGLPIRPPRSLVGAFSPEGFQVPPLFTPLARENATPSLYGSVDAPRGVTRVGRRGSTLKQCSDDPSRPCVVDADCEGTCGSGTCGGDPQATECMTDSICGSETQCGPSLFEVRPLASGDGVGPIEIASSDFELRAELAVPLSGLRQTDEVFAFVSSEQTEGLGDLNGDLDDDDLVLTLASSVTGARQDVSSPGSPGIAQAVTRATTRSAGDAALVIRIPALVTEGDLVGFLVPESREGKTLVGLEEREGRDRNGDDDTSDFSVQAFRSEAGAAVPLVDDLDLIATPIPVFDGQPLALSDGLLFFLTSEGSGTGLALERVSLDDAGDPPLLGLEPAASRLGHPRDDGTEIAFESEASNLEGGAGAGVWVRDRLAPTTRRIDLHADTGLPGAGLSGSPFMSGEGRYVAFESTSMLDPGDTNSTSDIYVRDRDESRTVRVSVSSDGAPAGAAAACSVLGLVGHGDLWGSHQPVLSRTGRFVVFRSCAAGLVPEDDPINAFCLPPGSGDPVFPVGCDVYVHDRDRDGDGTFDQRPGDPGAPPNPIATEKVSVTSAGESLPFASSSTSNGNFLPPEGVRLLADCLADPDLCFGPDFTSYLMEQQALLDGAILTRGRTISDDGRKIAFESFGQFDPRDDASGCEGLACIDVYLRDRTPGQEETILVSRPHADGLTTDGNSFVNQVSSDGRYVLFTSFSSVVVPDDTNGQPDVFLYDREGDTVTRQSVTDLGEQTVFDSPSGCELPTPPPGVVCPAGSGVAGMTSDARVIAFFSDAVNLASDDVEGRIDLFLRNRLTGFIGRQGIVAADEPTARLPSFQWTPDLGSNTFTTRASYVEALGIPDEGGADDVYWAARDPDDSLARDLNGDGDILDGILQVVDLDWSGPGQRTSALTSAQVVSVAGGRAAYLEPEADAGAGMDQLLNGDADSEDLVVRFFQGRPLGGAPGNLRLAASDVALSEELLAALGEERDEDGDLNGDSDAEDRVAMVLRVTDLDGDLSGFERSQWRPLAEAEALWVRDDLVATLSPSGEDRVVRLFRWDASMTDPVEIDVLDAGLQRPRAEEVVLGPEGGRCASSAPGASCMRDEECPGGEICVDDAGGGGTCLALGGSCRDASDCGMETCRRGHLLAFRTRECSACPGEVAGATCPDVDVPDTCSDASECDVNDDGDCRDDVLQTYDFAFGRLRASRTVVPCDLEACNPEVPYRVKAETVRFLVDERAEQRDLNDDGDTDDLLVNLFSPRSRRAPLVVGQVERGGEAPEQANPSAASSSVATSIDPLAEPAFDGPDGSSVVFLSSGVCIDPESGGGACDRDDECAESEVCVPAGSGPGTCRRASGTCRFGRDEAFSDCPGTEACAEIFAIVATTDSDGDEIPDPLDNCPEAPNADQFDCDGDTVGDVCDVATCGNGKTEMEGDEECDDGNLEDGDGCTRFCRIGGCFGDVDLDGQVDAADRDLFDDLEGCYPCIAGECNRTCDQAIVGAADGVVNNLDLLVLEQMADSTCDAPPDPAPDAPTVCPRSPDDMDAGGGQGFGDGATCGLGPGVALALAPLLALRRRRR